MNHPDTHKRDVNLKMGFDFAGRGSVHSLPGFDMYGIESQNGLVVDSRTVGVGVTSLTVDCHNLIREVASF